MKAALNIICSYLKTKRKIQFKVDKPVLEFVEIILRFSKLISRFGCFVSLREAND